ncbi:MAG TPA: 4-vinyl reductase [Longimicrobiaceae bacterium]|nr:4-vinyl reductase [Longimicrobiaceae bacterium]
MAKKDRLAGGRPAGSGGRGGITPLLPLILFETMRDMDRPPEVLEGEDLAASLPRRFGLNDVVHTQIHRFREEVRRKRPQGEAEIENLIRLVIRRPDAEEIFREAGRRIARLDWEDRSHTFRRLVRHLPPALALRSARRASLRIFRRIAGNGRLHASRRQLSIRIAGSLTARADPGGAACALYSGVLTELLERYTGRDYLPEHPVCETRGAEACEWTAEVRA